MKGYEELTEEERSEMMGALVLAMKELRDVETQITRDSEPYEHEARRILEKLEKDIKPLKTRREWLILQCETLGVDLHPKRSKTTKTPYGNVSSRTTKPILFADDFELDNLPDEYKNIRTTKKESVSKIKAALKDGSLKLGEAGQIIDPDTSEIFQGVYQIEKDSVTVKLSDEA